MLCFICIDHWKCQWCEDINQLLAKILLAAAVWGVGGWVVGEGQGKCRGTSGRLGGWKKRGSSIGAVVYNCICYEILHDELCAFNYFVSLLCKHFCVRFNSAYYFALSSYMYYRKLYKLCTVNENVIAIIQITLSSLSRTLDWRRFVIQHAMFLFKK